ncbi:MAG: hypothetical protein WBN01_09885, partial [Polyangiales bacterium]
MVSDRSLFESETFADRNVPQVEGIVDEGRAEVTKRAQHLGQFRAPTLRNIFESEPYFHNGSVKHLEDAARHELEQSGISFDEEDVRLIELFIRMGLRDDSRSAERPRT